MIQTLANEIRILILYCLMTLRRKRTRFQNDRLHETKQKKSVLKAQPKRSRSFQAFMHVTTLYMHLAIHMRGILKPFSQHIYSKSLNYDCVICIYTIINLR